VFTSSSSRSHRGKHIIPFPLLSPIRLSQAQPPYSKITLPSNFIPCGALCLGPARNSFQLVVRS